MRTEREKQASKQSQEPKSTARSTRNNVVEWLGGLTGYGASANQGAPDEYKAKTEDMQAKIEARTSTSSPPHARGKLSKLDTSAFDQQY